MPGEIPSPCEANQPKPFKTGVLVSVVQDTTSQFIGARGKVVAQDGEMVVIKDAAGNRETFISSQLAVIPRARRQRRRRVRP
jgi:RNase P/RNase MRP subunit p29